MACSSSCPTQDHESYGACLRSKRLQVEGADARKHDKSLTRQLDDYATARKAGMQPASTFKRDVDIANRISDATGVPYRA